MSELSYIRTRTLEAYVDGDGQKFTDVIIQWAQVYFLRCGIKSDQYSINGVSFRADGGTDGFVDAPTCSDAIGLLAPKSVFQFKAGKSTKAKVKAELQKEPKDGSTRIVDRIRNGFKVVWFIGKGLTDDELQHLESDLAEIVEEIQAGSPKPVVIDANRLSRYLSRTPAIASRIINAGGLFFTSDMALSENPHAGFAKFVPGSHFESLKQDIVNFLTDAANTEPIKYIAGEPGIGKSRCILEAIEGTPALAGLVCYFPQPSNVKQFFALATQEGWCGYCIIDEYIGESVATISVTADTIPRGLKAILIGHSHITDRKSVAVTNEMQPLSEDEMVAALSATFPALPEFRIREAIQLSKQNLRLARSICDYLARDTNANLDFHGLEKVVDHELARMNSGKQTLAYLALVPMLLSEDLGTFCQLAGLDSDQFRRDCREVNQSSGLIQANDHTLYVGAPALAQVALVRLWREEKPKLTVLLQNPGKFLDGILTAIRLLAPCPEKEEMLSFFRLPVATLSLPDLIDGQKTTRLLQLLTADPETYLPAIHRVIKDNVGRLSEYPYEGTPVGRRDLIWRLRDLAQFEEYFEMAEEIVFLLALEETPSGYHNIASSYWPSWFGPYFDNTVYPYDRRLSLLASRAKSGGEIERKLILSAVDNPFPDVGTDIPSERVGGRLAPPELRFIHHAQLRLAAETVPAILEVLLTTDDEQFRLEVGKGVCNACFSWLEKGAIDHYTRIVTSPLFPAPSLRELVVQVRHYVSLRSELDENVEPRIQMMHELHRELLKRIDQADPFIEVLEIAERGYWGDDESSDRYKQQLRVLERCLADPKFKQSTLDVLVDPEKHGGGKFGDMIGPHLTADDLKRLITEAWLRGFSQFSFAATRTFVEAHPESRAELLSEARTHEQVQTRTSLAIYQLLGDDTYFEETTRILRETNISSKFFGGFWIRSADDLTESKWRFIGAIGDRLEAGDPEISDAALNIAGELSRNDVTSEASTKFCLRALQATEPGRGNNSLLDWDDVGEWLLTAHPGEVISLAASKEQSEFSQATAVLAKAAPEHSAMVLDALVAKLTEPYQRPILLHGGLKAVFAGIGAAAFIEWLPKQSPKVWENVASHLPRPFMEEGVAKVPELTRAFWNVCPPEHREFERAMGNFLAHTFSTGVFWGHGIDLFSERVDLAKQLLSDPSAAIRIWADHHLKSSEAHLQDALRSESLDQAHRETEG